MANLEYLPDGSISVIDPDEELDPLPPGPGARRFIDAQRQSLLAPQPQVAQYDPLALPPVDDPRSYMDVSGVGNGYLNDMPSQGSSAPQAAMAAPQAPVAPQSAMAAPESPSVPQGGWAPLSPEDQDVMSHLPEEDTHQIERTARAAGVPLPTDAPPVGTTPGRNSRYNDDYKALLEKGKPVQSKPKWYQTLAAAALAGGAGWSNAASRTKHPIETDDAIEGILHPGYQKKLQDWRDRIKTAGTLAGIEASQNAAARQDRQDTAKNDLERAQAEKARADAERADRAERNNFVKVTKKMADESNGYLTEGTMIPASLATEGLRVAAGKYWEKVGNRSKTPTELYLDAASGDANAKAALALKLEDDKKLAQAKGKPADPMTAVYAANRDKRAADAEADRRRTQRLQYDKDKLNEEDKIHARLATSLRTIADSLGMTSAEKDQAIRAANETAQRLFQENSDIYERNLMFSGETVKAADHIVYKIDYPTEKTTGGALKYPNGRVYAVKFGGLDKFNGRLTPQKPKSPAVPGKKVDLQNFDDR